MNLSGSAYPDRFDDAGSKRALGFGALRLRSASNRKSSSMHARTELEPTPFSASL
jgi:hypothetical protein